MKYSPKHKICFYCKHWKEKKRPFDNYENKDWFFGKCAHPSFTDNLDKLRSAGMYHESDNYEGYGEGFVTGEDFGCIHWRRNPMLPRL